VTFVKQKLLSVLKLLDEDKNETISQHEFEKFDKHPDAQEAFQELGVDQENLLSLTDVIFADEEEEVKSLSTKQAAASGSSSFLAPSGASFAGDDSSGEFEVEPARQMHFVHLLEMILNLRTSNTAMVKDIVELRKLIRKNQQQLHCRFQELAIFHEQSADNQDDMQRSQQFVAETVLQLTVGLRDLQERMGCSNPIEIPTSKRSTRPGGDAKVFHVPPGSLTPSASGTGVADSQSHPFSPSGSAGQ